MDTKKKEIWVTRDHTGKMEGINSISTSVLLNEFCQAQRKIKGSICSHCYAQAMAEMYSALGKKLAENTAVLTSGILPIECLPTTEGMDIFRFEAFGDLNNMNQLQNYMNIVKKNPRTRFTLWTKRFGLVHRYFSENKVPDNFTLIISSMKLNKPVSLEQLKKLGKFKKGQLKSFTVYDFKFIKKTGMTSSDINCGSRSCFGCRICYDANEIEEIKEILKSDREKVDKLFRWTEPELIRKQLESLSELDELEDLI